MYHLSSLLLSGSWSTGSSGAQRKAEGARVYQGDPAFHCDASLTWHSFGNYLFRLYLFVLVNVFNTIQQIFIEHYYQALGDIKINKA